MGLSQRPARAPARQPHVNFLAEAPLLQRLELHGESDTNSPSTTLIARTAHILSHFAFNAQTLSDAVLAKLQSALLKCSRLSSLSLHLPAHNSRFLSFVSAPPRIESLDVIIRSAQEIADLESFSSLRSLSLEF